MTTTSDPARGEARGWCCEVCGAEGTGRQFGTLHAHWGEGSQHAGEQYRLRLCELCFFQTLAHLRREHDVQHLFDDEGMADPERFGRIEVTTVEEPAAAKRVGMLRDQLGPIPEDFDALGSDEIRQRFEGSEDTSED
ncbi:hypothetical protein KRX52_06210 [Pseudomonas sp. MAP12]|uniref:C2H2-type domain-containing protein n=1 Tax=Geopseudomonas aromaticivorans TaxID=2849492 RepID=A0ABS6MUC2_9GAMM|nr:hypothetical protein [Pseudomonas aromaticivorans]